MYARSKTNYARRKGRRFYRRRSFGKTGIKQIVQKQINQQKEFKVIEGAVSLVCNTGNTHVSLLNATVEGDDIYNREGRKIWMRSLELDMFLQADAAADASQFVKVALVYDHTPLGVMIPYNSVYTGVGGAGIASARNLNERGRYVVLKEWYFKLSKAGTDGDKIHKKAYFRWPGLQTLYDDGNDGDIRDLRAGALYLMTIGTISDAETTKDSVLIGGYRIRFTD